MLQNENELRPGSLGKLHELLEDSLPEYRGRDRHLSVSKLADGLEVSAQYLYRWFENERIPAKYVRPLIALSDGNLSVETLAPFALK